MCEFVNGGWSRASCTPFCTGFSLCEGTDSTLARMSRLKAYVHAGVMLAPVMVDKCRNGLYGRRCCDMLME